MELYTLVLTLAIILPFFIQFHYLLEDPWKLCRAFHYYSSMSKQKIPKKPQLILHYPRLPSDHFKENSVNSMISESITNIRSLLSTPTSHQFEKLENELDKKNNLQLESSTFFIESSTADTSTDDTRKNIFCEKRLDKKAPAMLNILKHNSKNNKDINKDITVKSGLTDLINEQQNSINSSNAQMEYLYSRDLFLFEYRKRPEVKTEGTQSENVVIHTTRTSRAWR